MNELEKMARKARKKQKGMSPFTTFGGDPEKNIDAFNHTGSAPSSTPCCGASEGRSVADALEELNEINEGERFLSSNALRILDEANLRRISKGHERDGYAIISASREHRSEEENNKKTNELRQKLKDAHYSYIMVYGGYKENGQSKASLEKSFVVFPYDISNNTLMDFNKFKDDMIKFCTDSDDDNENQDSILICEPGRKPHYIPLKKGIDVYGDEFNSVEYNNMNNEFFTALKKWSDSSLNRKNRSWDKGLPRRYTLKNECFIDDPPSSMQAAHSRWAVGDLNHIYKENINVTNKQ